jgi:hypothetical protein
MNFLIHKGRLVFLFQILPFLVVAVPVIYFLFGGKTRQQHQAYFLILEYWTILLLLFHCLSYRRVLSFLKYKSNMSLLKIKN